MSRAALTARDRARIDEAVSHFKKHRNLFQTFAEVLLAIFRNSIALEPYIHFMKYRIKDPEHLRGKIERKYSDAKRAGDAPGIDASNVFEKVTDLAGIRIIHLHTDQMKYIHEAVLAIIDEQQLRLVEKPVANCWDIEYERLFQEFGIATQSRDSMYTTVHYLIGANQKTSITCELQVRTLMDEVWAEVSHRINYPTESPSETCKAQLKILARLTSGCARLVDSIFRVHAEATRNLQ